MSTKILQNNKNLTFVLPWTYGTNKFMTLYNQHISTCRVLWCLHKTSSAQKYIHSQKYWAPASEPWRQSQTQNKFWFTWASQHPSGRTSTGALYNPAVIELFFVNSPLLRKTICIKIRFFCWKNICQVCFASSKNLSSHTSWLTLFAIFVM